ncbi:MAG: helix-turn-helix transcriptional regulator [Bacteroidales bacterium]|nr:helix-turn-helix transcriptional regulator [Bacteroidales bacterium]
MKENVSTLRLDMVPSMARTLSLKDEIVISDNLDSRVPEGIASRLRGKLPTRTLKPHDMSFPYRVAFHTILFVESGRVDCRINLKDYRIEGCAIFLAASGIVLDYLSYQAGTRFLIIAYSDAGGILPVSSRSSRIIRAATYAPLLLPVDPGRMDRHLQVLRVVQHVAEAGPDYSFKEDIVEGFAKVVAGGIARIILERNGGRRPSGRRPTLLRQFIASVQKNCDRHRDLEFYARELCVTPKYLSRIVSEQSGRVATEIIREYVIAGSRLLLSGGEYNVQQVSNLMGFPNASYFGRYFLKATGMTPRQFQLIS